MSAGYGGYPPRPAGFYPIIRGLVDTSGIPEEHKHVFREFDRNLAESFVGLTTDGTPRAELFPLTADGPSTDDLAARGRAFLDSLTDEQRLVTQLPVEAEQWRGWINAFAPTPPHGSLMDDLTTSQREKAMAMFEAAFSPTGYDQIRTAMRINGELARIAGGYEDTLREWMYWIAVFGEPRSGEPWGFQMYGHHSCVNVFVLDGQLTIGPMFLGAEPRIVETASGETLRAFDAELQLGLDLMRSLTPEQQQEATLAQSLRWADLPPHLAHPTEGRMRGSVARDNAVIPEEGVRGSSLDPAARERLRAVLAHYLGRMREPHAAIALALAEEHLDETTFAWAGPIELDAPFYYKVHNPLVFIELDAHSGIFIGNDEPEQFHIHNIVRTPNGNDYGRAWLAAHLARRTASESS
jgi:hypothetical protein